MTWYEKYKGLPYKHLGEDPVTGIDCGNLIKYVLKKEHDIDIWYSTSTFCNITDDDWYNHPDLHHPLNMFRDEKYGWVEIHNGEMRPFDIIVMTLGATNMPNHVAMYVGDNKLLQITIDRNSWIGSYGNYYKQYTEGHYRWKSFITN